MKEQVCKFTLCFWLSKLFLVLYIHLINTNKRVNILNSSELKREKRRGRVFKPSGYEVEPDSISS